MNALRVENLTKVYKKKSVLDSISFSAESNKTTVILGLDKSGKSTLTKILSLIQKPTTGNIYYFDNLKVASDNFTNDVSYMPEELGLSEHLTVFENLHIMALTRHFKTKGVKELTIEYLKKYGLYPLPGGHSLMLYEVSNSFPQLMVALGGPSHHKAPSCQL